MKKTSSSFASFPLNPARVSRLVALALPLAGVSLATVAGTAQPAHAWGGRGHEIVGGIADLRLQSPQARAQVNAILKGQSMAEVASWPDFIRALQPGFEQRGEAPEFALDPDTVAFVKQLAYVKEPAPGQVIGGSGPWHYVNLPRGAKSYDTPLMEHFHGKPLETDIVMRIQECIRVLQSDVPIDGAWGKRNALRTLVHLVGDVHMPLHVGCGFVDESQNDLTRFNIGDPATVVARKLRGDRGGNDMLFGSGPLYESIHSYWDDALVEKLADGAVTSHRIVGGSRARATGQFTALLAGYKPRKDWESTGALTTWPVQWTRDSLAGARTAYEGITVLSNKKEALPNQYNAANRGYRMELKPSYDEKALPIVEDQLARAGYRLARLLDAIWPAK